MKLFFRLLLIPLSGLFGTGLAISAENYNSNYLIINPLVAITTYQDMPLSDVLQSSDVITQDEIAASTATSFGELINRKIGVEVTRAGGPGGQTSVFLRGQASKNYLLLIDGVKAQTDAWGNIRPIDLPLTDIYKIEVLRGNASALYGDAAIGGVINIITKTGKLRDGGQVSVTYGSQATKDASASLSQTFGGVDIAISAAKFETEGLDATKTSDFDKDEFERSSHSIALNKHFSAQTKLAANYKSSQSEGGLDGFYNRLETQNTDYTLSAEHKRDALIDARFDISKGKLRYDSFGAFNSFNRGKQTALKLVNTSRLGKHEKEHVITQGLEKSDSEYGTTDRKVQAMFIGYQIRSGKYSLQTNLRRDNINVQNDGSSAKQFSSTSWLAGYGYQLTPNMKASLTRSTGFRAPSAGEYSSNSNVKSEEHVSTEFSLQHLSKQSLSRMTLFTSKTDNGIQSWPIENIEKIENQGVEFSLDKQTDFINFELNLTLQDPKIKNGSSSTKSLLKRAKTFASLNLSKALHDYNFSSKLSYSGQRYDVGNAKMKSYLRVDANLSRQLTPAVSASLKLENLTNADYETTAGYNTPDRSLFFTLKYNFATTH